MDRSHIYPLRAAVAATALGFTIWAAAAESPATYAEALRAAEQQHGRDSEQVLAPLMALGNALARSGHHEEAVPLLQRAAPPGANAVVGSGAFLK